MSIVLLAVKNIYIVLCIHKGLGLIKIDPHWIHDPDQT